MGEIAIEARSTNDATSDLGRSLRSYSTKEREFKRPIQTEKGKKFSRIWLFDV